MYRFIYILTMLKEANNVLLKFMIIYFPMIIQSTKKKKEKLELEIEKQYARGTEQIL